MIRRPIYQAKVTMHRYNFLDVDIAALFLMFPRWHNVKFMVAHLNVCFGICSWTTSHIPALDMYRMFNQLAPWFTLKHDVIAFSI